MFRPPLGEIEGVSDLFLAEPGVRRLARCAGNDLAGDKVVGGQDGEEFRALVAHDVVVRDLFIAALMAKRVSEGAAGGGGERRKAHIDLLKNHNGTTLDGGKRRALATEDADGEGLFDVEEGRVDELELGEPIGLKRLGHESWCRRFDGDADERPLTLADGLQRGVDALALKKKEDASKRHVTTSGANARP